MFSKLTVPSSTLIIALQVPKNLLVRHDSFNATTVTATACEGACFTPVAPATVTVYIPCTDASAPLAVDSSTRTHKPSLTLGPSRSFSPSSTGLYGSSATVSAAVPMSPIKSVPESSASIPYFSSTSSAILGVTSMSRTTEASTTSSGYHTTFPIVSESKPASVST